MDYIVLRLWIVYLFYILCDLLCSSNIQDDLNFHLCKNFHLKFRKLDLVYNH